MKYHRSPAKLGRIMKYAKDITQQVPGDLNSSAALELRLLDLRDRLYGSK